MLMIAVPRLRKLDPPGVERADHGGGRSLASMLLDELACDLLPKPRG